MSPLCSVMGEGHFWGDGGGLFILSFCVPWRSFNFFCKRSYVLLDLSSLKLDLPCVEWASRRRETQVLKYHFLQTSKPIISCTIYYKISDFAKQNYFYVSTNRNKDSWLGYNSTYVDTDISLPSSQLSLCRETPWSAVSVRKEIRPIWSRLLFHCLQTLLPSFNLSHIK